MKLICYSRFILLITVCCAGAGTLSAEDQIQSLVTRLGEGEDVSKQLMSHGIKAIPALKKALLATGKKDSSVEDNLLAYTGELLLNAETRWATLRMLRAVVCEKPNFLARYHKTRLILKGAREAEGILSSYDHESGPAWRVGEMDCVIGVSPELDKLKGKKVRIVGRRKVVGLPSRRLPRSAFMTNVEKWYIPSEKSSPFSGAEISDIISGLTKSADFVTKQHAIDELANRGGYGMAWIQKNFDSSGDHIKGLLIHVLDQMCRALTADLPEKPYASTGWGEPVKISDDDVARLELVQMASSELKRIASQHKDYAVQIDQLMRIHASDIINNLSFTPYSRTNYPKWDLDMIGTKPIEDLHRCNIKDQDLLILAPYMEQIKKLDLQDTRITDLGLSFLSNLKNLEILHVGNRNFGTHSKFISGECTRAISSLPKLKELHFGHVHIGEQGLSKLASIESLETLSFNGGPGVGKDGFGNMEKLKNLKSLSLVNSNIKDEDLVHIGKLNNLKSLALTQTPIVGDGLKHLQGLTKLESLNLSSGDKLSTLKDLKAVKSLKVLDLTGTSTNLTAEALSEITGMELHVLKVRMSPLDRSLGKVVGKFPALKKLYTYRSRSTVQHLVPEDCQLIKEETIPSEYDHLLKLNDGDE